MATKIICDKCKKELHYWPKDDEHTQLTGHRTKGNVTDSKFDLCGKCFLSVIYFINGDK